MSGARLLHPQPEDALYRSDRTHITQPVSKQQKFFKHYRSRMALVPTQPPIQFVPGALSLGLKWPGREADHSPPSSAEVKEWVEPYLHSPIRHGVVLS
jgi:hypothetical protein